MKDSPPLLKVAIHSFSDRNYAATSEDPDRMFTIPINPESFTKNFKIELDQRRGHGEHGTDPRFKSTVPEQLRLDFVLDGTETMQGYIYPVEKKEQKIAVNHQIKALLSCVYDMKGEIHRPRFLKLFWGEDMKFPCILSNLDINYTLFNQNGTPLRAKISATFLNYLAQEARAARERQSSPDLTHYRKGKSGERLDWLSFKIYNDSKYFLQVAKANGLTSIRNLKPGLDIYFPPFDKKET
jgi:hypothetical protein